ncbi:MAG: IS5 family transposase [Bacteroidetes bacterium]|nr:MAG: IS5 family transposase [Bacteroidota bacterium]
MAAKGTEGEVRVGRPPALNEDHVDVLVSLTGEYPHVNMEGLTRLLAERTGVEVCSATVRKALKGRGIVRKRPPRRAASRAAVQGKAPARYGYTDMHRREATGQGMSTDLTDAEWALVAELFERRGGRGAPPVHDRRELLNACMYVVRTGCPWRLLPKTFPPWRAVYSAFRRWARNGTFERMHDRLREQWRARIGREPQPSAAIIDAQSTRSTAQGGDTGFDAGKKVKGRKRHLVVDTLGLLLAVSVTAASVQDRDAAPEVLARACAKAPRISTLFADSAYAGRCADNLEKEHRVHVKIVRHRPTGTFVHEQQSLWPEPPAPGFVVQAKRWVVERTHAWNERARRLIAHHDRSQWAPVAWVWLAEARILAIRLAA